MEINFTPEKQNLKQLRNEGKMEEYNAARKKWTNLFKEHYQTQLAGKTIEVEGSGHSIYFPESGDAKSRAAKGVRNQARAEAGKNMAQAVAKSYYLHQGAPEHREGEVEHRRKVVDNADSFHVFGCPVSINGERSLMWIAATHKKGETDPKKLTFYEFGVADSAKKSGGLSLVQNPKIPSLDKPPAKATLLDVLRDVKSDFQGKPRFLVRKDGDIQSSFRPLLRQAQMVPEAAEDRGRAKLEGDKFSKLLTTNQATHGSAGIINGERSDVKSGKEAPMGIFAMLLAKHKTYATGGAPVAGGLCYPRCYQRRKRGEYEGFIPKNQW